MEAETYEIEVRHLEGVASLAVSGELDMAGAKSFRERLCEFATDAHTVEVDLSSLRFVDSSGMQAIVSARDALVGTGREFHIIDASRQVRRVFAFAGLDELFADDPPPAS